MWKIIETQDGSHSILSEEFNATFHSKYGAIQESRHVFIEAGLYYKAPVKKELQVLEMGFGSGLNTYLTYLEANKLGLKVRYTTVENFPIPLLVAFQLNYSVKLHTEEHQDAFERMHEAPWGSATEISKNFVLEKVRSGFEMVSFFQQFDLIYYDAFAPESNPRLWERPMLETLKNALLPGGVLVTYAAKGVFKRLLKDLGFTVESLQGPPGKREMTRAINA